MPARRSPPATASGRTLDIGGNYTLSKAWGNFDAENVASGPVPFDYRYPEYKQASWNFPDGDLAVDQRHRARLWANYTPGFAAGPDAERAAGARERRAVRRGEHQRRRSRGRTSPIRATRISRRPRRRRRPTSSARATSSTPKARSAPTSRPTTSSGFPAPAGCSSSRQLQVLNVFNQFQLCACGSTVFGTGSAANAGGVNLQRIDTTVLTPGTTASRYAAFNPFTTTPVRGVNWDYGPVFGTALNRFAYTTPRTVQDVVRREVLGGSGLSTSAEPTSSDREPRRISEALEPWRSEAGSLRSVGRQERHVVFSPPPNFSRRPTVLSALPLARPPD